MRTVTRDAREPGTPPPQPVVERSWGAVRDAAGTPQTAAALLALAALALAGGRALARNARVGAADAFSTSLAIEVLAALLVFDAAWGLWREARSLGGWRAWRTPALVVRAGYLLVAAAFTLSLLARGGARLRVAEGEQVTPDDAQVVHVDARRPFSRGVGDVRLAVRAVEGRFAADGEVSGLGVDVAMPDGGTRRVTAVRPLPLGWTRLVWPERAGYALAYEIAVEKGAVLDAAIAKIDLAGHEDDVIRSPAVPHRFVVRLAAPGGAAGGGPRFHVAIYRGKLLVGQGEVGAGGSVPFEGLVLRTPEVRRWAELGVTRDPGLPVGLAGAALALAGIAWARSRRGAGRLP